MNTKDERIPHLKIIAPSLFDCFGAFYSWARRVQALCCRPRRAIPYVREMTRAAWHLYVLTKTRMEINQPPALVATAEIGDKDNLLRYMEELAERLALGAEAAGEHDADSVCIARRFSDEARKLRDIRASVGREECVRASVSVGLLQDFLVAEAEPDAFGD